MRYVGEVSEDTHKHLQLLHGIIDRLAGNSFLLKGWSLTLVSVLLTLSAKHSNNYALLALLPASMFWCLDAYYLMQERLFRQLYDRVRLAKPTKVAPFSMETAAPSLSEYVSAVRSPSVAMFHGVLLGSTLAVQYF